MTVPKLAYSMDAAVVATTDFTNTFIETTRGVAPELVKLGDAAVSTATKLKSGSGAGGMDTFTGPDALDYYSNIYGARMPSFGSGSGGGFGLPSVPSSSGLAAVFGQNQPGFFQNQAAITVNAVTPDSRVLAKQLSASLYEIGILR